jgi:hypothetical protein
MSGVEFHAVAAECRFCNSSVHLDTLPVWNRDQQVRVQVGEAPGETSWKV